MSASQPRRESASEESAESMSESLTMVAQLEKHAPRAIVLALAGCSVIDLHCDIAEYYSLPHDDSLGGLMKLTDKIHKCHRKANTLLKRVSENDGDNQAMSAGLRDVAPHIEPVVDALNTLSQWLRLSALGWQSKVEQWGPVIAPMLFDGMLQPEELELANKVLRYVAENQLYWKPDIIKYETSIRRGDEMAVVQNQVDPEIGVRNAQEKQDLTREVSNLIRNAKQADSEVTITCRDWFTRILSHWN